MGQIARLKAIQIANGNVINATDLDAEYNQLVNESNNQDIRISDVETGNITLQGTKTFASAPKLDAMEEKTAGQGIAAESVTLKQGSITLGAVIKLNGVDTATNTISTNIAHGLSHADAVQFTTDDTLPSPIAASTTYYVYASSSTELTLHSSSTDAATGANAIDITTAGTGTHHLLADPPTQNNGQLWFNAAQQQLKARINNQTWSMLTTQFLENLLSGPAPRYSSASAIVLPDGIRCLDSTNTHLMEVTSDITLNLGSAGVNGLDTGTEANDTWYFVYLIDDTTGANNPAGLFSTVNEASAGSITLPSGYDAKRQLPIAVRNDDGGDLIPFVVVGNQLKAGALIQYDVTHDLAGSSATNVLYVTTSATTFTDVDCSAYVPPISTMASLHAAVVHTASGNHYVRPNGGSHNGMILKTNTNGNTAQQLLAMPTDGSQVVEYQASTSTADFNINVNGYYVTEVQ